MADVMGTKGHWCRRIPFKADVRRSVEPLVEKVTVDGRCERARKNIGGGDR